MSLMKIVIDARMYGLEHAGIGRYIANLVREIKNLKLKIKNLEITLLVRRKNLKEIKKKIGDSFKIVLCEASHYSLKEQIVVPLQLIKLKPDLVHFPHFNVPVLWWGKQVVTIHDLIKHQSRGRETTTKCPLFYWFKYLNYCFLIWLAVKRATKIIVPTKWWKKELVKRYRLAPGKVAVIYEGVEKKFKIKDLKFKIDVLKRYGVKKPFVIYTGSLYPHKNVERLIKAIQLMNQLSTVKPPAGGQVPVSLVIVCGRNIFYERFKKKVEEMKMKEFVNLVGFVPDEELVVLYRQAEAFVFPSLMEGFGLPGLEAMTAGCPVLISEIPVLREVYGEAALYFNPLDIDDIAKKIKMILDNPSIRQELIKKGYQQVKKYSWKRMARETLRLYENCFSL